ncbi:MAG: radical SAM protein [Candidatus Omnitrophica bacterium]|nr:radical SAM protein [Candidatus Omnitrophota bacterium]
MKKFKVIISYPPLKGAGTPLLSQNRQFQWFKSPTYIYPIVPAYAATMLKNAGFDVIWNDSIAQRWDYERFLNFIKDQKPGLIAFETKTPVVKQHWKIINDINGLSAIDYRPLTILFGDHVTALPEESFANSKVDFVLTGGDYDFLLLNLCKTLSKLPITDYQLPITNLEPGIWYRSNGHIRNTGKFQLNHDLNSLPFVDRELTEWKHYAYTNGNYKRTPGTYIMSGRDCWWGKCTFCSWPTLYPQFRVRKVENVLYEIGALVKNNKIREIMDDTGTFPIGGWLNDFCKGMIAGGYNKKVYFDCNMRFGSLKKEDFKLMKKANFRLLLFGMESANQKTLDRLKKNLKVENIVNDCKAARAAGLYPHITIMFGYPWETYEDAKERLKLGAYLLKKGYAYTVQATVVIPYPHSPLFEECKKNGWLKTEDWDRYGMKEPVMKVSMNDKEVLDLVRDIYKVALNPQFLFNRFIKLRDLSELSYFGRSGMKVMGHISDFKKRSEL